VPDAPRAVRERAHYVTRAAGGRGAVREACELIMQAQNTYESSLAAFLV
jgi:3-deoxy-D-manno-octulosonate 8-phosphate phosphatase (KDO 8-P phosphatase)